MSSAQSPAWITALGAVTSVGLDVATTCASIRAGVSRPAELEGHESMAYLDYELAPTLGHPVPELARGFSGVGRWLQLAAAAIEDLCESGGLPPADDRAFWQSTVAYLVLPRIEALRFMTAPHCREDGLAQSFRDPLLSRTSSRFAPARIGIVARDRSGFFELLSSITWHGQGIERIIMIATDSLVDALSLQWLDEGGRLKNDMNPVGLSPAEASVAVMLEEPRTASTRGAQGLAVLHAVATDTDPERSAGKGPGGVGLARAAQTVLERSSLSSHGAAAFVSDLNGEVWRARELAAAQLRVGHERWSSDRMVLPVVSTGDPGAALPALQIAVAARSLQRGYAGGSSVLVTSSEPRGRVGAAVVGRA